jgi:hypothetical protein
MRKIATTLLLCALSASAAALVRGTTDSGRNFVTGGIGSDEILAINQERARYPLAVLTAATGSGAYLSDVHIRITDRQQAAVLETVMDGPWLLVDLPPGRYTIEAGLGADVKKETLSLGIGGHQQATFYFDTHDEIAPAGQAQEPAPGS